MLSHFIVFSCIQTTPSPYFCPVAEELKRFQQKHQSIFTHDISHLLEEFFQIEHFAADDKKDLFGIQIKERNICFLFNQKIYLEKAISSTDCHLIENFFLDGNKLKKNILTEHFPQYNALSSLFLSLWKCISHINFRLTYDCLIEKKEVFSYLLAYQKLTDRPQPILHSKHNTHLRHSFVIWKKENKAFILVKPIFKNNEASNDHEFVQQGAFKIVKRSAVLIQITKNALGQLSAHAVPYVTLTKSTDYGDTPSMKNLALVKEFERDFKSAGFKKIRCYDPHKNQNRFLFVMPDLGKTIDRCFNDWNFLNQREILMQLIDKCEKKLPFDVKIKNTTLDPKRRVHFIDSADKVFTFTPFNAKNGYYEKRSAQEQHHARILGLTLMLYQLLNPTADRGSIYDILRHDGSKSLHFDGGEASGTFLAHELKEAYFCRMSYQQLRDAVFSCTKI